MIRLGLILPIALLMMAAPAVAEELRPPSWLPHYNLGIDLDVAGHKAKVIQEVTWVNRTSQPIDELVFNVHSRYTPPKNPIQRLFLAKMLEIMRVPAREGIYDEPAFNLEKVELLTADGVRRHRTPVNARFRGDLETALVVTLPNPVPVGGTVTITLNYTMNLPQRQGRWGQWEQVTFLTNWHPVLAFHDDKKGWQPTPFVPWHQPFFNEAGIYDVRLRLPKDHVVACTGTMRVESVEGESQTLRIGPVPARDWSFAASARYKEFKKTVEGVTVRCVAFPEHEHYANILIENSSRAMVAYTRWFGPYPYGELNIAESYFGWNGNECCGMILIDERVFSMPHFAEGYVEYLITHETGHQWWYNVVGTDGFRETFMDEAFATYFAHRMLNQAEGKNNSLLKFPKGLGWLPGINREDYRYSQFYSTLRNNELGPAVQEMTKYRHIGNLFSAAYDRGGKIVGMVEDRLGEAAFLELMRKIYRKYYFRVIRVEDFQKELEEYTGQSWKEFFDNWLLKNGMTDWAMESVKIEQSETPLKKPESPIRQAGAFEEGDRPAYKATVIVRQKAEHDEPTTIGFSFDDGTTFDLRVPVGPLTEAVEIEKPPGRIEPLGDHRFKVEVMLPAEPVQVAVDPDQVLPDREPANNYWKPRVKWRVTPLYTFLDETSFTTAYDRLNVIGGPWVYGPSYADPWFTRASIAGVRAGVYRTEEFSGGVYTGYRSTYRDLAVGFDGTLMHWPFPRMEVGFHGEKSLTSFSNENADMDRGAIWSRYIIDESPSMYTAPMHHIETFASWQRNFLPTPRHTVPGAITFDKTTNIGIHYHLDLLTPYWDPEDGFKLDATYSVGVPILGQQQLTHQAWAQLSFVQAPPEGLGWLSETRLAFRGQGAWALPKEGKLYALGGDWSFRGFDLAERQGSLMWVGSVEWRMPVWRRADIDVADHFARLKNVYVVPFYDVGDIYLNGKSMGEVAHAVGLGFRFDVAWFSFLERTMLRMDLAKTVNVDSPTQFWFGIQHPF
jgi:hypothetical protein